MKGLQIFRHSVRQVTGNLEGALRVSGVLYAVQVVIGLILGFGMMANAQMGPGAMGSFGFGALAVLLVAVVTGLWIAVGWHRWGPRCRRSA